jgi:predicted secreted protein
MAAVAPTVTVTPSQATVTNVQAVQVGIAVAGTAGVCTGSVVLTSGAFTSGPAVLSNGQATITIPPGVLAVAVDTLSATYTPDTQSSANYTTATGTGSVTVVKIVVSLPTKLQGYKAQLAVGVAGALTIIAGLKDLTGGFKSEQLDATDHGNNGWKSRLAGLLDFEGSASLDYIVGDGSQALLRNAVFTQQVLNITLLPVDSAGSGADSFVGTAIIVDFDWDGKNTDLQSVKVKLAGAGPFAVVAQ